MRFFLWRQRAEQVMRAGFVVSKGRAQFGQTLRTDEGALGARHVSMSAHVASGSLCGRPWLRLRAMRATLIQDENDIAEVRAAFGWLRSLAVRFGCAIMVAHHLRKLSAVSNATRERVSGSRDIIASVDVHIAAKSREGRALHALTLDKTRMPVESAMPGTTWPIEAKLVPGKSSTFEAGDPEGRTESATSVEDAADAIRSLLDAEGPKSAQELRVRSGNMRRAFDELRKAGDVVLVGKPGKSPLYGLVGAVYGPDKLL
jgi:hypothetical protein